MSSPTCSTLACEEIVLLDDLPPCRAGRCRSSFPLLPLQQLRPMGVHLSIPVCYARHVCTHGLTSKLMVGALGAAVAQWEIQNLRLTVATCIYVHLVPPASSQECCLRVSCLPAGPGLVSFISLSLPRLALSSRPQLILRIATVHSCRKLRTSNPRSPAMFENLKNFETLNKFWEL